MLHKLFTIYDEKAEVFLPPFFVPTLGIALRAFTDTINSKDHQFGKHPADYTIFQLGSFDDATAELEQKPKKSLGNGVEFIDATHTNAFEEFEHGPPDSPIQSD